MWRVALNKNYDKLQQGRGVEFWKPPEMNE